MPRRTKKPAELIRTAALALFDRGLTIVPVDPDKKAAIWKGWPTEKRTRDDLELALSNCRALNIGLVLNQSDWIDIEHDQGDAGEVEISQLFEGEVPPTPTYSSPRGVHRLFRRPDGLPTKAVVKVGALECRIGNGKGALSVVPPSVGREWLPGMSLDDLEPAELPEHVAERLRTAKKSKPPKLSAKGDGKIKEGERNDTLYLKACALRQLGFDGDSLATALLDLNSRLCEPPLDETEVRAIAESSANGQPKIGFIERLLGDIELWHDGNDDPFATITQAEHKENWRIGKKVRAWRRWLSKLYYDVCGEVPSANFISDTCAMLEGKACFDGPCYPLWRRTAEADGKIYIDLCDSEWRAVEVDGTGWHIVSNPPVKFFRARAMQSLPDPERPREGETLKSLLSFFLNVQPTEWPLVLAWIVAAFRPRGPYPVLKLLGEQGAAKTTTARVLRSLVDPNSAPVRAEPNSTRDLAIAANNSWVQCFDNLSSMKPDLSDALCRLSTGGGFATRGLYTDDEEAIFDAMRPVILTSIEEIATRSDLLERSLILELPPIPEESRQAEKKFWSDFEAVRPRIFGALLDALSAALKRLPEIEARPNTELSRMADFEIFGEAAERGLGLADGEFVEAYRANRQRANALVLEAQPLIDALFDLLRQHTRQHKDAPLEDTATGLLEKLERLDSARTKKPGWPKVARMLSTILRRSAPALRQIGIVAVHDTRGGGNAKQKIWRITAPADFGAGPKTENEQLRDAAAKQTAAVPALTERIAARAATGPQRKTTLRPRKSP